MRKRVQRRHRPTLTESARGYRGQTLWRSRPSPLTRARKIEPERPRWSRLRRGGDSSRRCRRYKVRASSEPPPRRAFFWAASFIDVTIPPPLAMRSHRDRAEEEATVRARPAQAQEDHAVRGEEGGGAQHVHQAHGRLPQQQARRRRAGVQSQGVLQRIRQPPEHPGAARRARDGRGGARPV